MLPTTCHVYFGSVTGATPDGRLAGEPFSEGISPVQGRDSSAYGGPQVSLKDGPREDRGTLMNQKFSPKVLEEKKGSGLMNLVRGTALVVTTSSSMWSTPSRSVTPRNILRSTGPDRQSRRLQRLLLRSQPCPTGRDNSEDGAQVHLTERLLGGSEAEAVREGGCTLRPLYMPWLPRNA